MIYDNYFTIFCYNILHYYLLHYILYYIIFYTYILYYSILYWIIKLHFRWRWKCRRGSTAALVLHWTTRDSSFFRPGAYLEQWRDRSKLANAGQENVSFPAKEDRARIERPQRAFHVYVDLFCFWQNVSSTDDRDCQSTASIRSKWMAHKRYVLQDQPISL